VPKMSKMKERNIFLFRKQSLLLQELLT
jgi:hypothetical protein